MRVAPLAMSGVTIRALARALILIGEGSMDLSLSERLLLVWLGRQPSSPLEDCHGRTLETLIYKELADEYQGMVRLTDSGWRMRAELRRLCQ
jgi:hypothetical protein